MLDLGYRDLKLELQGTVNAKNVSQLCGRKKKMIKFCYCKFWLIERRNKISFPNYLAFVVKF